MEANDINAIRFMIDISIIVFFVLIWHGLIAFLRLAKKKNLVYLFFFTIFFVYIAKVLDYTLLQFQFHLLEYFMPDRLILQGYAAGQNFNLIPLVTLTLEDLRTSLLNILLFLPFGFGLPFITDWHMKKVVLAGAFFSIAIELLQFGSALMTKVTFRVVDINDVIFNTLGTTIGYLLFLGFIHIYVHVISRRGISGNSILRYR